MTTILKQFTSEINHLIKLEEFNKISLLFSEQHLSDLELVIFYKRNNKIFNSKNFWVSSLPTLHIKEIIESDIKVSFLSKYFEKDSFCNHSLNTELIKLNIREFIRFAKFSYAFNASAFWSSFQKLQYKFPEFQTTIKEFAIIREKLNYLEEETQKENRLILGFNLIDVISAFVITNEIVKSQSNVFGNKAFQTQIEVALVEELTRVISLFQKHNIGSSIIPFASNEELQNFLNSKTQTSIPDENLSILLRSIEKMIDRKELEGKIDLFCCDYADIINTDEAPYKIKTNRAYSEFVFNNKKSQPEEFYLMDITLGTNPETAKIDRISGESEIKHFNFYGIPTEVDFNGNKIDFEKVFRLVKHFSVYKSPRELSNEVPDKFKILFGGNEIISFFEYESFIANVSEYFHWGKHECEEIVNFLTTNPKEESSNKIYINNPFLKEDNKILWLGTFLRDRRWENIFLNKIKHELASTVVKEISKNLEEKIIRLLSSAGFNSFNIPFFKTLSGKSGDVDVLAYYHGNIIIAEVKSGGRSDSFFKARYSEIIKHEGAAAEQLNKIHEYVRENWEKIKEEYKIETKRSIDDINIYPIIITDYFEGDLELYKNEYNKTSLLELDVIINNNKAKLLRNYYLLQFYSNSNNFTFNNKKLKIDYDLWDGKKSISIDFLIKKVKLNAVWKEIGKIWKFEQSEYTLD